MQTITVSIEAKPSMPVYTITMTDGVTSINHEVSYIEVSSYLQVKNIPNKLPTELSAMEMLGVILHRINPSV